MCRHGQRAGAAGSSGVGGRLGLVAASRGGLGLALGAPRGYDLKLGALGGKRGGVGLDLGLLDFEGFDLVLRRADLDVQLCDPLAGGIVHGGV